MMINVIITIAEKYIHQLHGITSLLKKEGLQVSTVYEFGVIAGQVEQSELETLKRHEEVFSIAEEKIPRAL
ncbi:MAG: hypothetical protein V4616_01300 [Bacteroidota bacterium]